MKYSKIYLASWNKQKLERLKKLFTKIDENVGIEIYPDLVNVKETWTTAMENTLQKIEPYKNKDIKHPILTIDHSIFFDNINFDPTLIKRKAIEQNWLNEFELHQEDIYNLMLEYYKNLATEKWWELEFYFLDSWAILFPNWELKTTEYKREYILTDKVVWEKQLYFPLCNLYKSKITWKYRTTWDEKDFFLELQKQIDAMKYLLDI